MPWFDCLTTTCDPFAGIPVTDLDIAIALPFSQWSESYLLWPDELWYSVRYGVPCMDVDKNAYHIQRLAAAMLERLEWIGTKPELDGDRVIEGNHRVRAVKYLYSTSGVVIPSPL